MKKFAEHWRSRFESLMSWQDFELFWEQLAKDAGDDWYIFTPGEDIAQEPADQQTTLEFLRWIAQYLRDNHQEKYCAIVYVDNKANPEMIKIYDPGNLGEYCSVNEHPPLPFRVLSKTKPEQLDIFISPDKKSSIFKKIFNKHNA